MVTGKKTILLLVTVLYFAGAVFILYPAASNFLSRERNKRIISAYEETVEVTDENELASILEDAEAYNRDHKRNYVRDAFADDGECNDSGLYMDLLDPKGNGVMGYLEIPKINETLAIYHGAGEEALEKGAGHIEGTSLPVGGEGTHSVLAAHRGLPSAKLFTDIDRLEAGDRFYLHVLDRTLTYEVDRILVVGPGDIDALRIEDGEDLVTLLTCTPYGVNTKRLLVRGHRIYPEEGENEWTDERESSIYTYSLALITILTVILLIAAIAVRKGSSGRRKNA